MLKRNNKKNILIVDDDEILIAFLLKCLSRQGYNVVCLPDGSGIPKALEDNHVDVVFLDAKLPGRDGFYWLNWLKNFNPNIPVIMASAKTGEDNRVRGLENGALDYLIKPFSDKELLIRIENIFYHSPARNLQKTIHIGDLALDTTTNYVLKDGEKTKLTLMEANILKLLYHNADTVLSRDEIMEYVRGTKHNPLDRSIDIHINKIRKKIEDDPSKPTYIRTVRGKGYRLQLT
jgi:DNA-binding response OmpR family regulator